MNVLFLMSDEHNRSVMGCSGHPLVSTPNLDALAARGTRFPNAYTPSPICVPARASLATGLHVFEHGCWSSAEPYHGQHESWMHRVRDAGVDVVSVGKLHFRDSDADHGFTQELDAMYLANDGKGWPQGLVRDPMPAFPQAAELAGMLGPGESDYTAYDRGITAAAVEWLRHERVEPWVLFVSMVSPHYPLISPPEFYEPYADVPMPARIPPSSDHPVLESMRDFWDYDRYFDDETRDRAVRNYYGLTSFMDDNVGQIVDALGDRLDETLVIYTSDHGDMLGDHGFWCKSVMYEGSAGVPMIAAGPCVPVGVNKTPVSLTDIGATIEDAVGIDPPAPKGSWSSRPIQSFFAAEEGDRPILSEYHDGGSPTGSFMIRSGRWKYVHYADGSRDQLFDLDADPTEMDDLGADSAHDSVRVRMFEILTSIVDPDVVNRQAFEDQAKLLDLYGGAETVMAMPSFNHTPLDG